MRRDLLNLMIGLLLPGMLLAQKKFATDLIPGPLKENANAVIRIHEEKHIIKNTSRSEKQVHLAVTVLNEKGMDEYGCISLFYNKFIKLKNIDGAIYDATGDKIQNLKKEDIRDYSNFDGKGEVTDNRQKYICLTKNNYPYPYTIEFSYTEENSNGMFYPVWFPVTEEHTGIEISLFSVVVPADINFRYKELNLSQKAAIIANEKEQLYSWSINNMPPVGFDDGLMQEHLPIVYTAPGNFEVDGYQGNASSWENIGKFYTTLNQGRDSLPAPTKTLVKEIASMEKDTVAKIEKIYRYMQSKTRYISIQLGIGGWQCMPAYVVDQKGYGDCKALSNYMVALLGEANIKAYPVLIMAGRSSFKTMEDFPSFHFNHVIVCVPLAKDTVWLECTSQTNPAGYLGSFTGYRKGLVITGEGGSLVSTIHYLPADNSQRRKISIDVNENGDAKTLIECEYRNISQEYLSSLIEHSSKEKQKELLASAISVPRSEVMAFSFSAHKSRNPVMKETIDAVFRKFIPVTGTIFVTPHIMPEPIPVPVAGSLKGSSFSLDPANYSYFSSDTVSIRFPESVSLETLPENIQVTSALGEFKATFAFHDHTLLYCRSLLVKGGKFPSGEYQNWISFIKQINKSDKLKVVLHRK